MRVLFSWLKKYINLDLTVEQLSDALTFAGIEVESVDEYGCIPDTVVTANIVSAIPVEGSDHLQVCKVDNGEEIIQVICGAPNCTAGLITALAQNGSLLGDFKIKTTKIRGYESQGMLCSSKELGISDNHEGILILPQNTPIGAAINKILDLPDTIFELEITPNRPDLLGYIGVARDLSAILNLDLSIPEVRQSDFSNTTKHITSQLKLINEVPELCIRYTGRIIHNVKVKESPLWLKDFLQRCGLKSINNIVDITNFVMLESGHPLHAFDYHKLESCGTDSTPLIKVRNAYDKEEFPALDGKVYELDPTDMVIADGRKAIAIAGVIGGMNSHITEETTSIVLESACFLSSSVRKTSYRHKINTDSSYRFERGMTERGVEYPSDRAIQLILEIAGGELVSEIIDSWESPSLDRIIGIRPSRFEKVIGYSLDDSQIKQYLSRLGLTFIQYGNWIDRIVQDINEVYCHHSEQIKQGITEFTELDDCCHTLYFQVPHFRVDLSREIDIIEELARLDGYDKVPEKPSSAMIMDRESFYIKRKLTDYFVNNGFFEVLNYSFIDPESLKILKLNEKDERLLAINLINPQNSNQSVMRTTLIPQIIQNTSYNLNHGEKNIRLFEQNKVYLKHSKGIVSEPIILTAVITGMNHEIHWKRKNNPIDFFFVKGLVEGLLDAIGLYDVKLKSSDQPFLLDNNEIGFYYNDILIGFCGQLNPQIAMEFGIDTIDLKQDLWIIEIKVNEIIKLTRGHALLYQPIPRFPSVERDLSFLIDRNITFQEIKNELMKLKDCFIRDIILFDEYQGKQIPEGLHSLSLRFILNNPEKTLTDVQVEKVIENIITFIQDNWKITLR